MFETGKIYKVKVELAPGQSGFGRATILDKSGGYMCVSLKTTREANKILPKGTRLRFGSDAAVNTFNGLWFSTVIGTQLSGGKTVMICGAPKLEPQEQKRRSPRVTIDVPAAIIKVDGTESGCRFRTKDISSSGIAVQTSQEIPS